MSADASPLSGYWSRRPPVDTRPPSERVELADQIAAELERVGAGEFPAYVVLSRYTPRELLAAMCHWGLTSERSRSLRDLAHPAPRSRREARDA